MKSEILLELATRWEHEAKESLLIKPDNKHMNEHDHVAKGAREAKRECADTLRTLVQLFPNIPEHFVKQTK